MPSDSKTDAEATFALNLESNIEEKSDSDAAAIEGLRQSIAKSEAAVRQLSAANRALRGSTAQVTDARAQLKAKMDAEKNSVSAANLALLKQGVTYARVADDAKKLAAEQAKLEEKLKAKGLKEAEKKSEALGKAIHLAGGPVEDLKGRFDALKGVLGGGSAAMAGFTLAAAAAVAGLAALTAAGVALGASFVRWIAAGADAARNMNILRLATTGTEQNAKNLGTQVDDLASKLSTPKEQLNLLAASLGRTRLSGQAIVDTFQAVARSSDALGDDVGSTIKDIIIRGQQFNRFQLNPLELQGKGLSFDDVAVELAKNLKTSVGNAQQILVQGRATVDQGAKALRQAVEKNFAKINAAKLLSLDVQLEKFHEDLAGLTSGVNIEPLLRGFAELRGLFSQSTVMGATLKSAITTIGNALGPAFEAALPTLKAFFKGAVIGALDVGIAFLKLGKTARNLFGDDFKGIDFVKAAELPFKVLAGAVDLLRESFAALDLIARPALSLLSGKGADVEQLRKDMKELGFSVGDGVAKGIAAGAPAVGDATRELANKTKADFANTLQIHSPSRVFVEYGENTAEGFEQGVRSGAGDASDATSSLGGSAPGGASSGGSGGASLSVSLGGIHLHVSSADGAKGMQAKVQAPSFLAELTKAVQEVCAGAGIPTQIAAAP